MKLKIVILCLIVSKCVVAMKKDVLNRNEYSLLNVLGERLKQDTINRDREAKFLKIKSADNKIKIQKKDPEEISNIKENFQDALEKIKNSKREKEKAVNLDEYLSRIDQKIDSNPKQKRDSLIAIFKQKPLKNYIDSIWCAHKDTYPLIFKDLTLWLPQHEGLTIQFIDQECPKMNYISAKCIQDMALLYIPKEYKKLGEINTISLQDCVSSLQDLLCIAFLDKNNFSENAYQEAERFYNNLNENGKKYVSLRNNKDLFFLKTASNSYFVLSKDNALKSNTLKDLLSDNFFVASVDYSQELIEIFWNIVTQDSSKPLDKLSPDNIENILNMDLYFNVAPISIQNNNNFLQNDLNNLYNLFKVVICKPKTEYKNLNINKTFLYQTFIVERPIEVFPIAYKFLQKDKLPCKNVEKIKLQKDQHRPIFLSLQDDQDNIYNVLQKKEKFVFKNIPHDEEEYLKPMQLIMDKSQYTFKINDKNITIKNSNNQNRQISINLSKFLTENDIATAIEVFPKDKKEEREDKEKLLTIGTDKGNALFFKINFTKKENTYYCTKKLFDDSINIMTLSEDGKYFAAVGNTSYCIYETIFVAETPQQNEIVLEPQQNKITSWDRFKKWIVPGLITITGGAYYLYKYFSTPNKSLLKKETNKK